MIRMSQASVAATLALAWVASSPAASFAGDQPALWSDTPPSGAPAFTVPSDKLPPFLHDYLYRTDPTGQVVSNQPSPSLPSEQAGKTDLQFLTYSISSGSRLDTTDSACTYYNAISGITGVTGCGPNGALQGSDIITFEKWKQAVRIDKYGSKDKTDTARFINQVDLNLTRDHHMVSYGENQLAAYVCNHAGPSPTAADPTGFFPPQSEVDGLIKSIRSKASLIACVAMEYSTRGQSPGTKAFTKFLIFGANGELLSTVDLDGRGPKGVPNVCTACHGGTMDYNKVSGDGTSFFDPTITVYYDPGLKPNRDIPANIRPPGDLGAHFLPFDKQNFAFSSKLSSDQRDEAIFKLNLDVYITEKSRVTISNGVIAHGGLASAQITDLISGWYHGKMTRDNPAPGFDATGNVPIWWDYYGSEFDKIYLNSYAHSCRTCHVAMENAPLEREPELVGSIGGSISIAGDLVCNTHTMPNAKVTFDRFWLSDPNWTFPQVSVPGQPASAPNQPSLLNEIMHCVSYKNP